VLRALDATAAQAELDRAGAWLDLHVSDHAGAHHRLRVLRHLHSLNALPPGVWAAEIALAAGLCARYPGHEALWELRRCLWRECVPADVSIAAADLAVVAATAAAVVPAGGVEADHVREDVRLAQGAILWARLCLVRSWLAGVVLSWSHRGECSLPKCW
jgi:hypothetical protein